LQNKANFVKDKTNATLFAAKDYENKPPPLDSKKQTQSNPNEPNVKIGKMKISTETARDYANQERTMNNERLFKTNPIEPNSLTFFRIAASALEYTKASLRVRISRDRASAEGESAGAGSWMKRSDLQQEVCVQDEDKSGNSL